MEDPACRRRLATASLPGWARRRAIRGLARAGGSIVSSELCCFMLLLHPASCCFMPLHPALRARSATKCGSRDRNPCVWELRRSAASTVCCIGDVGDSVSGHWTNRPVLDLYTPPPPRFCFMSDLMLRLLSPGVSGRGCLRKMWAFCGPALKGPSGW